MTKPVWLMDVDGVLNNFSYLDPLIHSDFKSFKSVPGYMISYSPSLMQRILDLHHSDSVEVRWLTTWQGHANKYLREIFGFNTDLVVEGGECNTTWDPWWKLPLARSAVESYGRVIWTDDEIHPRPESRAYVEKITKETPEKLLAISPNPCLTHKDLDTIEEWINA